MLTKKIDVTWNLEDSKASYTQTVFIQYDKGARIKLAIKGAEIIALTASATFLLPDQSVISQPEGYIENGDLYIDIPSAALLIPGSVKYQITVTDNVNIFSIPSVIYYSVGNIIDVNKNLVVSEQNFTYVMDMVKKLQEYITATEEILNNLDIDNTAVKETISNANIAKENLERIINTSSTSKKSLEDTISESNVSKNSLEEIINNAANQKTILENTISNSNIAKEDLENIIINSSNAKKALELIIHNSSTAKESLEQVIDTSSSSKSNLEKTINSANSKKQELIELAATEKENIVLEASKELQKIKDFTILHTEFTTPSEINLLIQKYR